MTTTGTKTAATAKMNAMVTIKNGAPLPGQETTTIPSQGTVEFTNADAVDHVLQFSDRFNDRHTPVCVLLPAGGSLVVVGGSSDNDKNATCGYLVSGYAPDGIAPADATAGAGGGNKIIIGSGS